jgi:hypothetical protein
MVSKELGITEEAKKAAIQEQRKETIIQTNPVLNELLDTIKSLKETIDRQQQLLDKQEKRIEQQNVMIKELVSKLDRTSSEPKKGKKCKDKSKGIPIDKVLDIAQQASQKEKNSRNKLNRNTKLLSEREKPNKRIGSKKVQKESEEDGSGFQTDSSDGDVDMVEVDLKSTTASTSKVDEFLKEKSQK